MMVSILWPLKIRGYHSLILIWMIGHRLGVILIIIYLSIFYLLINNYKAARIYEFNW